MRPRSICLVVALLALLLLVFPGQQPKPASASVVWVYQPVSCTMGDQGTAATISFSASTGTVSPASITCNGTPVNLNVTSGATIFASEPADTPPTRYRFPGVLASASSSACSGATKTTCGTSWSLTDYFQWELQASYTLIGGGSPTPPTFACTSAGSALSTPLATSSSAVWADNGCTWSVTPNPLTGSGPNERWETQSVISGIVSGAQSLDPVFFNQYDVSASFSVLGGGAPSPPSLLASSFGSPVSFALTASPQGYWLDSNSAWSVSNPAPGSGSTERWEVQGAASGTVTSSVALTISYYHQYYVPFSYSVTGGGTGYSSPVVTYSALGSSTQATLATTANSYWVDAGSSWSASSTLGGGTASETWSTSVTSGRVNSASAVVLTYYHQYLVSTSYSVSGGGSGYSAPTLTFQSYGSQSSGQLSQGPYWVDAGGSWSVSNPLVGSSSLERWETNATTSGMISSALTLTLTYFHQYDVTFGFVVLDGGSGYSAPAVTTSQFGAPVTEVSGWADAGSRYTFTNPLNGSSSTQRWYTGSGQGSVTSASSVSATYYHQYDFVLSYSVIGSTPQGPPSINSTALGLPFSTPLQTAPVDHWIDSGSTWTVSTSLPGSGTRERWMTAQSTTGKFAASSTAVVSYYDQYPGGFTYSVQGGGSPAPPSLNYTTFGSSVASALNSTRVVYWLDTRSAWSLTNPILASSGTERWIASQGTSGASDGPFDDAPVYTHQYFLTVKPNVQAGGALEVNSGWYNSGSRTMLNATASSGWRFSEWLGEGTGSYTGSNATESVSFGSTINETAIFYAGLSLNPGSGGTIEYRYAGQNGTVPAGNNLTLYLMPGTPVNLTSTPSTVAYTFAGWSGKLTGTAQNETLTVAAPTRVSAAFSLDYTDIGTFYVVAAVVMVIAVYVFVVRRRHAVFGSSQLSTPR